MLGEEEKLDFHWRMTGRVADLEADHTSGLGGLSNRGCNGLSIVHTSLVDYQTLILHSPEGLNLLEIVGTYQ
jgi:hypothetical protein